MCEPATIAMFAIAGLSAVASHQAASGQAKVQTAMYEQNLKNANAAMVDSYKTVQERQAQESEAAGQQIESRRYAERAMLSTAQVAAGESNISGWSVESILRDMGATASRDITTIEQNRDWAVEQLSNEALGIRSQAQNQANSMTPGQKPSAWATAFKIGEAGANAYLMGKQLKK